MKVKDLLKSYRTYVKLTEDPNLLKDKDGLVCVDPDRFISVWNSFIEMRSMLRTTRAEIKRLRFERSQMLDRLARTELER